MKLQLPICLLLCLSALIGPVQASVPTLHVEKERAVGEGAAGAFFAEVKGKTYLFKSNVSPDQSSLRMRTGNVEGEVLAARILNHAGIETPGSAIVRIEGKEGLFVRNDFVGDRFRGDEVVKTPGTVPLPRIEAESAPTANRAEARRSFESLFDMKQLRRLQVLDLIMGNGDRHGGNFFLRKSASGPMKLIPIDHNYALVGFGQKPEIGESVSIMGWQRNFVKSFNGSGALLGYGHSSGTVEQILGRNDVYQAAVTLAPDRAAYGEIVAELKKGLSDEFIRNMIRDLPPEIDPTRRRELEETLRWRRDHVGEALDAYLAKRSSASVPSFRSWIRQRGLDRTSAEEEFLLRRIVRPDPAQPGSYVLDMEGGYRHLRLAGAPRKEATSIMRGALLSLDKSPHLKVDFPRSLLILKEVGDAVELELSRSQSPARTMPARELQRLRSMLGKLAPALRLPSGTALRHARNATGPSTHLQALDGAYLELDARLKALRDESAPTSEAGRASRLARERSLLDEQITVLRGLQKDLEALGGGGSATESGPVARELALKRAELRVLEGEVAGLKGAVRRRYLREGSAARIARMRAGLRAGTERFVVLFGRQLRIELTKAGHAAEAGRFVKRHGAFLATAYLFTLLRLAATAPDEEGQDSLFEQAAEAIFSQESLLALVAFAGTSTAVKGGSKALLSQVSVSLLQRVGIGAGRALFIGSRVLSSTSSFAAGAVAAEGLINGIGLASEHEAMTGRVARQLGDDPEALARLKATFKEGPFRLLQEAIDPMRVDFLRALLEGSAFLGASALSLPSPYLVPLAGMSAATAVGLSYDGLKARFFDPAALARKMDRRIDRRFDGLDAPEGEDAEHFADDSMAGLRLHRVLLEQFRKGMGQAQGALHDLGKQATIHQILLRYEDGDLGGQLRAARLEAGDRFGALYGKEPKILHLGFGSDMAPQTKARVRHLERRGIPNPPFSGTIMKDEHVFEWRRDMQRGCRRSLQGIAAGERPVSDETLDDAELMAPLRAVWAGFARAEAAAKALASLRAREEKRFVDWLDSENGRSCDESFLEVLDAYHAVLDEDTATALETVDRQREALATAYDDATFARAAEAFYKAALSLYEQAETPIEDADSPPPETLLDASFEGIEQGSSY